MDSFQCNPNASILNYFQILASISDEGCGVFPRPNPKGKGSIQATAFHFIVVFCVEADWEATKLTVWQKRLKRNLISEGATKHSLRGNPNGIKPSIYSASQLIVVSPFETKSTAEVQPKELEESNHHFRSQSDRCVTFPELFARSFLLMEQLDQVRKINNVDFI